jgi:hypothetical protein
MQQTPTYSGTGRHQVKELQESIWRAEARAPAMRRNGRPVHITIYRRHSADCPEKGDRYAPCCGCSLAFQFNWKQDSTTLDGRKLQRGQNKWTAKTRSWSEAQTNARKLEKDLSDLLQGKPVRYGVSVEAAVNEWLEFRQQNKFDNTKAKLMGSKLTAWCGENNILPLTALTTDRIMKFRMSLPFRTGDSSSLSVHWAVINGFFNWCVGMGYIDKNPSPNPRQMPQFAIRYDKPEVTPPTRQQVEKVLHSATDKVKLLCELMR